MQLLPESIFSLWRSEKVSSGEAPAQSSAQPTSLVRTAAEPTLAAGQLFSDATAYQSPGLGDTSFSRIGCSSKSILVSSSAQSLLCFAALVVVPLFLSSN